jgi:hypothetical protein
MDGRFACPPGRKTPPACADFDPGEPTITRDFVHPKNTSPATA